MAAGETLLIIALVGAAAFGGAYFLGALCEPFKLCPPGGGGGGINVADAYKDILAKTPQLGPRKLTGTEQQCGVLTPQSINCSCDKCGYCQWQGFGPQGIPAKGPRVNGGCANARATFLRQFSSSAGYASYPAYSYPTINGQHPMQEWAEMWDDRIAVT